MVKVDKRSLAAVLLVATALVALVVLREKIPAAWTTVDWPWSEAPLPVEAAADDAPRLSFSATYKQGGVTYTVRVPNPDGKATGDELRELACRLMAERVGPGLDEDFSERMEINAFYP